MLEHMMMLVLQLGVIIFAAHGGGLLFKRFRMPSVLGELLSGALIGPYALGALALPGLPEEVCGSRWAKGFLSSA